MEHSLPNFLIIGAQKAGTTSLYGYLYQHPQILRARKKEVHYFDLNYSNGLQWYRSHFAPRHLIDTYPRRITGEASPYYLFHPLSASRIHCDLPGVKLIVLLRNPVDRAISHYFHAVQKGEEDLPIWRAFEEEEHRLEMEFEKMLLDPSYQSTAFQRHSYKARGIYVTQIERFMELFGMDDILILKAEDMFQDYRQTLHMTYAFLGVDPGHLPAITKAKNVGTYPKHIPPGIRDYLNDYFRPYNEQLYNYLDRDFGW